MIKSISMKIIRNLICFFVLCSFSISGQTTFQTTYAFGGCEGITSIQQTHEGGYIVAGYSNDGATLFKINSIGDTLWTRTIAIEGYAYSVQQTNDNGYILLGFTGLYGINWDDIFLTKVDSVGNITWMKTYGGAKSESGTSVKQTNDGGYIMTGYTNSFGTGNGDVYLIKTNSLGDTLWTKTYGGSSTQQGNDVVQSNDGGYIITGYSDSFNAGNGDIYVIKTDAAGNPLWTKTYGGAGTDVGNSIQKTSDGGYIIAGSMYAYGTGSSDVYLIKINAVGDTLWTKTYGSINGNEQGQVVKQSNDKGYILVGSADGFGAGGNNVYLVKTDSLGNLMWTKIYGSHSVDYGYALDKTSDGGYIIGGYATFTAQDSYIIKTDFLGNSGNVECYQATPPSITTSSLTLFSAQSTSVSYGNSSTMPYPITGKGAVITSICRLYTGEQYQYSENSDFRIYPNPTSNYSTLEFKNKTKEHCTLTLYNVCGQLVRTIDNITNEKVEIEKNNLINGFYFFQLQASGQILASGKLVIE